MRPPKKKPPMDDPSDYQDLRLPKNDGQCEYCGCALPPEYHPNCKVCGGPRKAATKDRYLPPCTWVDYPADAAWTDLSDYSRLTFAWGAEQAAEQEDAAWRGLEGFALRKEGLSARIARHLRET